MGLPGGVVLGEHGQATFTILNEGALEVQFDIQHHDIQVCTTHLTMHARQPVESQPQAYSDMWFSASKRVTVQQ